MDTATKRRALQELAGAIPLVEVPDFQDWYLMNPFHVAHQGAACQVGASCATVDEVIDRLWEALVTNLPEDAHIRVAIPGSPCKRVRWDGSGWRTLSVMELHEYSPFRLR